MKIDSKAHSLVMGLVLVVGLFSNEAQAKSGECIVDEAAIKDIADRENRNKEKEAELAKMESDLKAEKKAIEDKLRELEEYKKEILGIEATEDSKKEERVGKLVSAVETMSPKSASTLMSSIDEPLAVEAMSRLSTPKLAKIMNIMDAKKASRLSERLAYGRNSRQIASENETKEGTPNGAKSPAQQ